MFRNCQLLFKDGDWAGVSVGLDIIYHVGAEVAATDYSTPLRLPSGSDRRVSVFIRDLSDTDLR